MTMPMQTIFCLELGLPAHLISCPVGVDSTLGLLKLEEVRVERGKGIPKEREVDKGREVCELEG